MFNVSAACSTFYDCTQGFHVNGSNYYSAEGNSTPGAIVGRLLGDILPTILGIAGFLTVIIIVVAGIQFIASNGDPKAAEGAKGRLTYAIIGFVVIILSFAILQIVNALFLGTNIV
ncbi:MAG TPA: hypothetical protein VLE91_01895 [Candidatus Saccharimonadales bacterium]|nr:hypothetical protein [Candidatus Saccharimonadales bacterium]